VRRAWPGVFVAALTVAAFWPCLRNGFVSPDDAVFLHPPYAGFNAASLSWMFTHIFFGNYVPLSLLTLAVDSALFGMNPWGYHLTNVLFHAATAGMFYAVCLRLFAPGLPSRRDRAAAIFSALLFSLHPLRVQSVAWVSERRDVVCGLFFLLTIWLWLGKRPRAALAAFALSLLAKSAAIPLPAVLVLLEIYPLRRLDASPRRWGASPAVWRDKIPFVILSVLFALATLAAQRHGGAVADGIGSGVSFAQKAQQVIIGLAYYLGKTLYPIGFTFYEWRWAPIRTATLIGAAATAAFILLGTFSRRLRLPLFVALGYQALMLAPVLGFVTFGHELVADRYSYLAELGWAALVGGAWRQLPAQRRLTAGIFAGCLLAFLAARTYVEIGYWKDTGTLWRRALVLDHYSYTARPNLADALVEGHREGEAILLLEEHHRLFPQDREVGAYLDRLIAQTKTTFRDHAGFYEQLGRESMAQGKFDVAAWHFEHGLHYDPQSQTLHDELDFARIQARAHPPRSRLPIFE
jgi:hypothetical protein